MKSFIQYLEENKMAKAALAGVIGGIGLGLMGGNQQSVPAPVVNPVQTTQVTQQPPQQIQQKQEKSKVPGWHSLISGSEGIQTEAYWDDTGKKWTIGKGSTTHPDGRPVKRGDKIKPDQANQYMEHYVNQELIPKLEKIPTWDKMNTNQKDALISFGYNVGPNFYGHKNFETITKALSSEQGFAGVPNALKLYNKSGGKVLRGLITRRAAEGNLWIKKD